MAVVGEGTWDSDCRTDHTTTSKSEGTLLADACLSLLALPVSPYDLLAQQTNGLSLGCFFPFKGSEDEDHRALGRR